MSFNRDVSVVVAAAERPATVLDGLAGSGIRGVRIAAETTAASITINDINPAAAPLIAANIAQNACVNAAGTTRNVNALMLEKAFAYIDIDPFGSPIPFLDAAFKSIRNRGLLAVTATDMMNLCGIYKQACVRKYGGMPLRTPYAHELALRLLIGAIVRLGAQYGIGISPQFSHFSEHYVRTYVRAVRNAGAADAGLETLGYALHCTACGRRRLAAEKEAQCACGAPVLQGGPLWTGPLYNASFVDLLCESAAPLTLQNPRRIEKVLAAAQDEACAPALFYTLGELSKMTRASPPKQALIETLREQGWIATGTHFESAAIKTNADIRDIIAAIATLQQQ